MAVDQVPMSLGQTEQTAVQSAMQPAQRPATTELQPVATAPQPPSTGSRRRRLGRWAAVFAVPLAVAVIAGLTWAAVAGRLDAVPLLDPALAVIVEAFAALALVGSWISRRRRWYCSACRPSCWARPC
jgi:hypothetical protein